MDACPTQNPSSQKAALTFGIQLQTGKYLLNYVGIFDAGDHLHGAAAVLTGFDVDIE